MTGVTGHRRLLEQMRADGVRHLFGNPGSTEEGLLDEIARFPDVGYVLGLQEAAVVCLADGYAQATHRPSVVLLHSGVGLGNAVGSLCHAKQRGTPMVVLAGEAGVVYEPLEAHMAADLVGIARPVTKYATRAVHPASVLRQFRRCMKVAATPPQGPVLLALPQDVLDQVNDEPVLPTVVPDTRVLPEPARLREAAELLAGARSPLILVGDGVAASEAVPELERFAEAWGAPVCLSMASELLFPWTHPLCDGLMGHMFGEHSGAAVADADAVLVCGTYLFPDVFPLTGSPFRDDARIVHVDLDPYAIAKNHPVTLGLVSDPRLTLRALTPALRQAQGEEGGAESARRAEWIGARHEEARRAALEADRAVRDRVPLRMSAVAERLAALLPDDAVVFDEALTHSPDLTRWLPPRLPGAFFQTPGGTLGVGIPGAVGAKIAHPERTVVGFTGDGGAMFTFQALWTAAHHGIDVKLVVCHNSGYRLLKENLVDYRGDLGDPDPAAEFPWFFDVDRPCVDFVAVAGGLGVPAQRITEPAEIEPVLKSMLDHEGPFLVEVRLERDVAAGSAAGGGPVTEVKQS
ncbi:thiamine pyrophosphate-binding protein [Actinomadura rubrisoli]|uniref:Thiamine pyrophosphate-binding protein n=1 Tax=Actinomadura rubrisoli TaxID=2530368 RepID=A0A4R5AXC4_9ACTN|nr:thiamine pyrophosphate-binding protein [Actinomadura rubrisoli]TDD76830.1 thiamine pyrophosphate-binding protein [Actinomadura rubrisoli]